MNVYLREATRKITIRAAKVLERSHVSDNWHHAALVSQRKSSLPHVRYMSRKTGTSGIGKASKGTSGNGKASKGGISDYLRPLDVELHSQGDSIGAELAGKVQKGDIIMVLNKFYRSTNTKTLAASAGVDDKMFHQGYVSFRRFCVESPSMPDELHILYSDIIKQATHEDSLFPYFLDHLRKMYPHIDCMEDLRQISDMSLPANWYPEARSRSRRIIFHAGPTNSGKTFHALKRLKESRTGVYCGPLRMLASEVYQKLNDQGVVCDLVTGEERKYMGLNGVPSDHVASTVEMINVTAPYEVAVIDEIQMLRDPQRSWAWTRALLGVNADEVHLCGEVSTVEFVRDLVESIGDSFELHSYKRLTPLKISNKPLEYLKDVQPGDCIVCFSKQDIYKVTRELEAHGVDVAVIYGSLPPGTKLAMAKKFNDPDSPCKVLVATDAIGMGINLNIRRVIFYSLLKLSRTQEGFKYDLIEPSLCLQIAGRAGRFGTSHEKGEVTTFNPKDLPTLTQLMQTRIKSVEQAGLFPTYEEVQMFSYMLPKASLTNILDIFSSICQMDEKQYFLCEMEDMRVLASLIDHIKLDLKNRYVFCCAPAPHKYPFVGTMFIKFARKFSRGEPVSTDYLMRALEWPYSPPKVVSDLTHLEAVFDILDVYRWLGLRFVEIFPDVENVTMMQEEICKLIEGGIVQFTTLLKNSDKQKDKHEDDSLFDTEDSGAVRRIFDKRKHQNGDNGGTSYSAGENGGSKTRISDGNSSAASNPNVQKQNSSAASNPNVQKQNSSAASNPNVQKQNSSAASNPNVQKHNSSAASNPHIQQKSSGTSRLRELEAFITREESVPERELADPSRLRELEAFITREESEVSLETTASARTFSGKSTESTKSGKLEVSDSSGTSLMDRLRKQMQTRKVAADGSSSDSQVNSPTQRSHPSTLSDGRTNNSDSETVSETEWQQSLESKDKPTDKCSETKDSCVQTPSKEEETTNKRDAVISREDYSRMLLESLNQSVRYRDPELKRNCDQQS